MPIKVPVVAPKSSQMSLPPLPLLNVPANVSRPKGSRVLFEGAVARLAPYKGERVLANGMRKKMSESIARKSVEGIARMYNTNKYLEKQSPRSAAVILKIKNWKRRSESLLRELKGTNPITARLIYGEARRRSTRPQTAKLFSAANVAGLLSEGRTPPAWHLRVSSLVKILDVLERGLPKEWEREGHAIRDKGGKRSHFIESEGTAIWRLGTDALEMFNVFKSGEATGTEEGDFHQFVNEIFEYATGREANDGIFRTLRHLIKPTREEHEIERRNDEILKELESMAPGKTIEYFTEEQLKRHAELHAELHENFDRRAELSKITWPHAPLPSK